MTIIVIVPESMEAAIKRDLDKLRDSLPEDEQPIFEAERDYHRQQILNHYAQFGTYPEIEGIEKT